MSNRYEIRARLGCGSYSTVFKAWDSRENRRVAMKVELMKEGATPRLEYEAKLMNRLRDVKGVPEVYDYYTSDASAYLIMEYLGKPIQSSLAAKPLVPHRAGQIVGKAIKVLRGIHNRSVLHRDLKPQNILFGRRHRKEKVYIIDFNLSTVFRQKSGAHIVAKEHSGFVGTKLFCSGNAYMGNEQSRRDDLESIVYVLVWMIKQSLPWCHVSDTEVTILEGKKLTSSALEICQDCPHEVCELLNYVKSLHFQDMPDYGYMMRLIGRMRRLSKCGSLVSASWRPETMMMVEEGYPAAMKNHLLPISKTFSVLPNNPDDEETECSTPLLKPPVASFALRQRIRQMHELIEVVLPV